jgi:glycosyltransferase involved in cell wall biosynthesis
MPLLFSLPKSFLVIPSSGEGWGRPHVEAMSCGRPVVATNWSGPTAYLTATNGYPLSIEKELVDVEGWPGHKWAAVSRKALRATLRRLVDAEATGDEAVLGEVATKGREARALMLQNFSLPVMGGQVQSNIAAALARKFPQPKPALGGDEL